MYNSEKESKQHLKRLSAVEKEFLEETKKSIPFKHVWNKEDRSFSNPFVYTLEGASFSLIGNKIFIFGGRNKSYYERYTYTYDLNLQIWDYKEEKIKGRAFHTTTVCNDQIYMFGGQLEDSMTNELYYFDHTFQLISSNSEVISERSKHSMVSWKKSLIVFGGYPSMDSSVYIFDKEWKKLETSGDIPLPRYGHSANVFNDIMYVFGGYTGKDILSKEILQLDLKTNIWKKLSILLPIAAPFTCSIFDEYFYLLPKNNQINSGIIQFNTRNYDIKTIETYGDIPKDFENCIIYNESIYTLAKTELYLLHLQEIHNYHFLNLMLKKDLYCDVVLYLKEKKYHCHKYLIAQSNYFKSIIEQALYTRKNAKDLYMEITLMENVDTSHFDSLIEFLYTGNISKIDGMNIDEFIDMLRISKIYLYDRLFQYLYNHIKFFVKKENILKILSLSHTEKWSDIKNYCFNFILVNKESVIKKGVSLHSLDKNLFNELMTALTIKMPSCVLYYTNFEYYLYEYVVNLYQSKLFTDVVIKSNDNVTFSAHLGILSAYSTYFCSLFTALKLKKGQNNFKLRLSFMQQLPKETLKINNSYITILESDHIGTEIIIEDFNSVQLTFLLEYIYTRKITKFNNDLKSILDVIKSGSLCQMSGLVNLGIRKIFEHINIKNAIHLIEFCKEFDIDQGIPDKCWNIIKSSQQNEILQTLLENQIRNSLEISELKKKLEKSERNGLMYQDMISQTQQQIQQLQRQLKKLSMSQTDK